MDTRELDEAGKTIAALTGGLMLCVVAAFVVFLITVGTIHNRHVNPSFTTECELK